MMACCWIYGPGHKCVPVLLPGFAIKWYQNQVTRQAHLRDLTHMQQTIAYSNDIIVLSCKPLVEKNSQFFQEQVGGH